MWADAVGHSDVETESTANIAGTTGRPRINFILGTNCPVQAVAQSTLAANKGFV
jgi:hypothetical protein